MLRDDEVVSARRLSSLSLDPRTLVLMQEFFGSHVCCVCKRPAERYLKHKFLCHRCNRTKQEQETVVAHEVRDCRPGANMRRRVKFADL